MQSGSIVNLLQNFAGQLILSRSLYRRSQASLSRTLSGLSAWHSPFTRASAKYLRLSLIGLLAFSLASQPVLAAPKKEKEVDPELRAMLIKSINEAESFKDRFDAEVWLLTKSEPLSRFIKDPEERLRMLRLIHREATRANVPPDLVLSVIHIESHFKRFALSHVGAQGIMQVMPFWKKEIGRENDNLIDLETNLRYGCTILRHYLNRENDHWAKALARYNGSYGSYKYSQKVMNVWSKYWR